MKQWLSIIIFLAGGVVLGQPAPDTGLYRPTSASISEHPVPEWFKQAKLGIFIHWGLYSVPGWAQGTEKSLEEVMATSQGQEWFANNPYAEWYLNSLKVEGSSTAAYHRQAYGSDFAYDDFVPVFNQQIERWNPVAWVTLFRQVGARYVVLTTKHHDGFLLWPSQFPNPHKENYFAARDLVGELTQAVTQQGMKMGLYYSSGLDWTFNEKTITTFPDLFQAVPQQAAYVQYVENHWQELMRRYQPWVLWADIGSPKQYDPLPIFADFYNQRPEGVVNNRHKIEMTASGITSPVPFDFTTPEYQVLDSIAEQKWETCRGIGLSFGYNRQEDVAEFLSVDELVDSFVDIVSKNGNLLLNVGPKADGSIPDAQRERLVGLGNWLKINGEALFDTHPWQYAEAMTEDQVRVRFTQRDGAVYVILLDQPPQRQVNIPWTLPGKVAQVVALDGEQRLSFVQQNEVLSITLPSDPPAAPAYAFRVRL